MPTINLSQNDTLVIDGNDGCHAFLPNLESEERGFILTAFWRGVSFTATNLTKDYYKILSETAPHEYIVENLRAGKTLKSVIEFYKNALNVMADSYDALIERDPIRYVGNDIDVILSDMWKDLKDTIEAPSVDECDVAQYLLFRWFIGVGVLTKLQVIKPGDDRNGFNVFSAPTSICEAFVNQMNTNAVNEAEKAESEADPGVP